MVKYTEEEKKILNWIDSLAKSQGFYGRLRENLLSNRKALKLLAEKDFKSPLDMITFLECE